ncbi:MAG TPA: hypothetical protein PLP93_11770 [Nitrosomonas sp.]|nr:hypothetical protein [Nitrosomonas sp.]
MDWKQYTSVVALAFSVVSFGLSYSLSSKSAVTSIRPVLVFEYTHEAGWSIRNVGSGPAMNILIAGKADGGDWRDPVRIPALQRDGRFPIAWMGHKNIRTLGATYVDIADRPYSSLSTNDLSTTSEGNLIRAWSENEIAAHWKKAAP